MTVESTPVLWMPRALTDPIFQDLSFGARELVDYFLLMLLELHEGGNGPWNVHLEGAKQLIDADASESDVYSTRMIQNIIEELTIFDVFGSTFAVHSPPTMPLSTRLRANSRDELSSLGGLGCPMEILTIIESVNLQWRTWSNYGISDASTPHESSLQLINTALMNLGEFDAEKWADHMQTACPEQCSITREHALRLSTIWKLAAEIYTLHVKVQLIGNTHPTPQVYLLVAEINCFESTNRAIRFLLWPTFIAGAESTLLEHRQWALTMLDKIWGITHIANSKTAAIVLMKIWEQYDSKVQYSSIQNPKVPSWMAFLSSLGSSWLFL
ncbi:hypothetical protein FSARC_11690 [Fusarium sarcochroum]|uniref:Regulatory protein n=1 Tax=Fusarium sarcochroum TaxID=1208366 RepID=A0A8H4TDN0_9HYPO|nr:hypothetical protein FSARC_11690 [Fusarium sarcochroum]